MSSSIVQLVIALVVVGIILTFAAPYIPAGVFQLILVVLAVGVLLWILRVSGVWPGGPPP